MRAVAWKSLVGSALCCGATAGATLDVHVADARGVPVADAVVTLVPRDGTAPPALRPAPRKHHIDQRHETFVPYLEVVRLGDTVTFLNNDHTRHHVYSFAPAKQFDFLLRVGEESEPLAMDHTGAIAVGCNIHDQMIAYVYVTDAPWFAQTDHDGHARLADLPPGRFDARVWQPLQKPDHPDAAQAILLDSREASAKAEFSVSLLPDPRAKIDRERASY